MHFGVANVPSWRGRRGGTTRKFVDRRLLRSAEDFQALGVYAMGVTLGTIRQLNWGLGNRCVRLADGFFVVGLPYALIAVVFADRQRTTARLYRSARNQINESVSLQEAIRELMTKTRILVYDAGATVAAFCGYESPPSIDFSGSRSWHHDR